MPLDSLDSKKLRITSKAVPGQVLVVQDGNTADGTATIKINDGFQNGYTSSLVTAGSSLRVVFDLESLESSRTGKEFTFSVQDYLNRNTFALSPGDMVEFWANIGAAPIRRSRAAWPASMRCWATCDASRTDCVRPHSTRSASCRR